MRSMSHVGNGRKWTAAEFGMAWWLLFGRAIIWPEENGRRDSSGKMHFRDWETDRLAVQVMAVLCERKKPSDLTYDYTVDKFTVWDLAMDLTKAMS